MTLHRLAAAPETVTDVLSATRAPVLTVEPGDRVEIAALDAWGHLERPRDTAALGSRLMLPERRGHCLVGPIAVRGAQVGQTLAVHVEQVETAGWGWTRAGGRDDALHHALGTATDAASVLWEIADGVARARGVAVPVAPFLGVLGLPPDGSGEHSTVPPRARGGGNIDCRDLVAGATLFLPVTVPDAYLHVGDGHAAQGHGEVAGTAIECATTSVLRLDLADAPALPTVHATTPDARITFGFDADLNAASAQALDAMLTWMAALLDVDRPTALALASTLVDLHVTQVANRTWGVHASWRCD